jgi:hypothetical protein
MILGEGCLQIPHATNLAVQRLLIHMFLVTAAMVMAI